MDAYWDDGLYRNAEGQRAGAVLYTSPEQNGRPGEEWSAIFPHRSIGRHATEADARAHVERAYQAWTAAQEAAKRR